MYMPSMTVMNLSERGLNGSSSAVFCWTSFSAGGLGGEVEVTDVVEDDMTPDDARIPSNGNTQTLSN
jgi:hypothetical protein